MLKCYCNESCFYYKKISVMKIEDKKYMQIHNFNRCNRLLIDNLKKKPCDFNSKILIEEKLLEEKSNNKNTIVSKHNNKILTYKDVYNIIYKMFKYYYTNSTNFIGKLNYYLKLIGYSAHDPIKETLKELKTRLLKKPVNLTKIYINTESYFSKSEGEFNYDYDNEVKLYKTIINGDDPLKWTKNEIIQNILKRKVHNYKKSRKSIRYNKTKSEDCNDEQFVKNYISDSDEDKSEEEESDNECEDEENNEENLKDNQFDIEEFSDDDNNLQNEEYDDFSD